METTAQKIAYFIPRPIDAHRTNKNGHSVYFTATGEELAWSGDIELPEPGQLINVTMNSIGLAIVRGYFQEYGYLGVMTEPINAPEWLRKQRNRDNAHQKIDWVRDGIGCEFGLEIDATDVTFSADQPNAEQRAALNHWITVHGRLWRSKLHDAWRTGIYGGFQRSNYLQQLRNQHIRFVANYQPRTGHK